jgi:hypothetical protein
MPEPEGEMTVNIGSLSPDLGGGEKTHFSSAETKPTNASFTADGEAEAAAAKEEAAKPPPTPLPDGVSQAQLDALAAAGFTVNAPAPPAEPVPEADPGTPQETPAPEGAQSLEAFQEYAQEFQRTGTLSEEARQKAMNQFGVSSEVVDAVLRGQQAEAQVTAQAALQEVGATMEQFTDWSKWSVENETEAARAARAKGLTSLDPMERQMALQNLQAAYNGAVDAEPTPQRGGPDRTFAQLTFQEALEQGMQDPRYYRKDAVGDAYRERLYAQLERKK